MLRGATALFLAFTAAAPLQGQAARWQLVGGVGGITGQSIAHRAVFIGALGRDVVTMSNFQLGAELTFGHLPTRSLVCLTAASSANCDLRELDHFGGVSLAGAFSARASAVTPYVRGHVGGWLGRDAGAIDGEPSRETGLAIAGEGGVRVHHVAVGLRLDQLDNARHGTVRIASIVARVSF